MALQMKSFDPKKIKLHAGVKKCHFGNFLERDGMAVPIALLVLALKNLLGFYEFLAIL